MASVSVTTSSQIIVAANYDRTSLVVANDSTVTCYLGPTSAVTASGSAANDGVPLYANQHLTEEEIPWKGDIYGITASGTSTIKYWERER